MQGIVNLKGVILVLESLLQFMNNSRTSLSNKIATSKCTKVKNGNASFKVPSNSRIAMSC